MGRDRSIWLYDGKCRKKQVDSFGGIEVVSYELPKIVFENDIIARIKLSRWEAEKDNFHP